MQQQRMLTIIYSPNKICAPSGDRTNQISCLDCGSISLASRCHLLGVLIRIVGRTTARDKRRAWVMCLGQDRGSLNIQISCETALALSHRDRAAFEVTSFLDILE